MKFPETQEEFELLEDEILQHRSQFPSDLRFAIKFAEQGFSDTKEFCDVISFYAESFLFGEGDYGMEWHSGPDWDGPYHGKHKGNEIELAIRLFPKVLKVKRELNDTESDEYNVLFHLASNSKGAYFIDRIANLYAEFGMADQMDMVGLSCELLRNTCSERRLEIDADSALREESLAVLGRLRDDGHVKNEDMGDLSHNKFLSSALRSESLDFNTERLRLLIQWNPTLLKPETLFYSNVCVSPLIKSFDNLYTGFSLDRREVLLGLYGFIWDLGMLHYPKDALGFAFHGWNFEMACDRFGDEKAREAMNDRIKGVLVPTKKEKESENNKNALQDLVLNAAMDDGIRLDGLYTLIRFDPGAALSRTNQTHSPKNTASK